MGIDQLKCDGTRAETVFRLSAKRTSPFKSAGASVQSTTGSRGVHMSGNNAGYTMFQASVKGTGYPLHSVISPSLPLPCVTVCHLFPRGVKRPGRTVNHSPPSSSGVKERLELYLYSPPRLSLWAYLSCYRATFTLS